MQGYGIKTLIAAVILVTLSFYWGAFRPSTPDVPQQITAPEPAKPEPLLKEISATINKNQTFFDIFKSHGIDAAELFELRKASAAVHDIGRLKQGRQYTLKVDPSNSLKFFSYQIDDDNFLEVVKTENGFEPKRVTIQYTPRPNVIEGTIQDNLISSIQSTELALRLSDIFAWDIDFNTDLRNGDTYRILCEELWLEGRFVKYGTILFAEIVNQGDPRRAYLFKDATGKGDYYDGTGRSLRRSFLKAPLSFRRISSGYSKKRFHPVLKTYRPHLGVDYAAANGTPVHSVGDGRVEFAARKGPNGNLVIIKHPNGYRTYYGHLSYITKGIRRGTNVTQGQKIGAVGSTGRSTGPHLDFRMKKENTFVNPLAIEVPRTSGVPQDQMQAFLDSAEELDIMVTKIAMAPPELTDR